MELIIESSECLIATAYHAQLGEVKPAFCRVDGQFLRRRPSADQATRGERAQKGRVTARL